MFDIFYADLDLKHPDVVAKSNLIKEEFWNNFVIKKNSYVPDDAIEKYQKLMFGKLLYFLSAPNKIKNKITVFFEGNTIKSLHPGQGRLVCYSELEYKSIPIIGIRLTTDNKYPDKVSNVLNSIVDVKLTSENRSKPYWIIAEPNHSSYVTGDVPFHKEKLLTINKFFKKQNLLNLDFYHKDEYICNIFVNQHSPKKSVHIEDAQGYFNFCKWLCGVSTSTTGFKIESK